MQTVALEIEAKLACDDAFDIQALLSQLEGMGSVGPGDLVRQEDRYFETRSRSLARAGLSARCRRGAGKLRLDVKPVPIYNDAVMVREELTADLPRKSEPGRAIRELVQERLPIRLRGRLEEHVVVKTVRQRHIVKIAGCRFELCFDAVKVRESGKRKSRAFRELELELLEGSEASFKDVVDVVLAVPGLAPSLRSKYVRALAELGLRGFEYGEPRPALRAGEAADSAARRLARALMATLVSYEPGTRVGLDPEQLHKMRVATRRLRSVLAVFDVCFSSRTALAIRRDLKWLTAIMGEVRDLDVLQGDLATWRRGADAVAADGWDAFAEIIARRRQTARATLLRVLDSKRYRTLLERAEREFSAAPGRRRGRGAQVSVGEVAAEQLGKRVKALGRRIDRFRESGAPEDVHQLRIAGKKLRYTSEFVEAILPRATNKRIRRLTVVQDDLGRFQDLCVQGDLARELATAAMGESDSGALLYVLGRMTGTSEKAAAEARERVDDVLGRLGVERLIQRLKRDAKRLAATTTEDRRSRR